MGDWPHMSDGAMYESGGFTDTGSKGVTLAAHSTINTEQSSYTTIISSTAFHAAGFFLNICPKRVAASAATSYLVDLAWGSAGNERNFMTDIYLFKAGDTDGTGGGIHGYFPIPIPAGTRISGRVRASVTVEEVDVLIALGAHGFLGHQPCGIVQVFGADTSDSGALLIDSGGTLDTLTWTEFSASLTYPIRYLYLSLGFRANASGSICSWAIRVARGASGAENNNVMFADVVAKGSTGSDAVLPSFFGPIPVCFNAGDRLAVGVQCSISDGNDRLIDCEVIGVY